MKEKLKYANGNMPLFETEQKNMIEEALSSADFLFRTAVIIVLPIVSILFFMNIGIGFITKSADDSRPTANPYPWTVASNTVPYLVICVIFCLPISPWALRFLK